MHAALVKSVRKQPSGNGIRAGIDLDFINRKYSVLEGRKFVDKPLTDIMAFNRASAVGYSYNSAGLLIPNALDVPRLDYDPETLKSRGLIVEGPRTNLMQYTTDMTSAATWSRSAVTTVNDGVTIAPDGTTNCVKLVASAATGNHFIGQPFTVADNARVTLSAYVKPAECKVFVLQGKTKLSVYPKARFDLLNKVCSVDIGEARIEKLSGGWYRCSISWDMGTGPDSLTLFMCGRLDYVSGVNFTGDGTSGLYIANVQLEVGYAPTSYMPSVGATQGTRASDVARIVDVLPYYAANDGTLLVDYMSTEAVNRSARIASFSNTAFTAEWKLADSSSGSVISQVLNGGSSTNSVGPTYTPNTVVKAGAVIYGGTTHKAAVNGTLYGTAAITGSTAFNQLHLGSQRNDEASYLNGWIRRLRYFPRRLPDEFLQALTKP